MQTPWSRVGRVMQLGLEGMAGVTLFAMMLLTTADVTGRYFFNAPILGAGVPDHLSCSLIPQTIFPHSTVHLGTALNRKNLCETNWLRDHHGA